MKKTTTEKAALITMVIMLTMACLPAASCGGEEGITTRTIDTATATVSTEDQIRTYASDIRDLAANADGVNTDYRKLVQKYEAGTLSKEEVVGFAKDAEGEFQLMISRLKETDPPEGFGTEHGQMKSVFDKWQKFYQLQIQGLDGNDAALLAEARDLDSQAAAEVNDAIKAINDKLAGA